MYAFRELAWLNVVSPLVHSPFFPLLVAASVLGAVASLYRGRLTRPLSHRQARSLVGRSGDENAGRHLANATRWSIVHDALGWRSRRLLVKAQRRATKLTGHVVRIQTRWSALRPCLARLTEAERVTAGERQVPLSSGWTRVLKITLFLGDIAIVSSLLTHDNGGMTLAQAVIASLAIATMQFTLGTLLGVTLAPRFARREGDALSAANQLGAFGVVSVTGIALMLLFYRQHWVWAFLAVAPAIAAAGIELLSHDEDSLRSSRARRAHRRPAKQFVRATDRASKAAARASAAWTAAAVHLTRHALSQELAVAAGAGLAEQATAVQSQLTEGVAGIMTFVEALQLASYQSLVWHLDAIRHSAELLIGTGHDAAETADGDENSESDEKAHNEETSPGAKTAPSDPQPVVGETADDGTADENDETQVEAA